MCVSSLSPLLGKPCRLCAHDYGCGTGHVVVVVGVRVLQLCGEDADIILLKESDAFFGGAYGDRHVEYSTDAGTYEVGIIDICQGIADDYCIHIRSLCRAEDGSEVAGLFNTLENNN